MGLVKVGSQTGTGGFRALQFFYSIKMCLDINVCWLVTLTTVPMDVSKTGYGSDKHTKKAEYTMDGSFISILSIVKKILFPC